MIIYKNVTIKQPAALVCDCCGKNAEIKKAHQWVELTAGHEQKGITDLVQNICSYKCYCQALSDLVAHAESEKFSTIDGKPVAFMAEIAKRIASEVELEPYEEVYGVFQKETTNTDGHFFVKKIGENHLNVEEIKGTNSFMFYTTQGGYSYNHPYSRAQARAEAIARGLNLALQKEKHELKLRQLEQSKTFFD